MAYNTSIAGGVRVAAVDVNGDGRPDIATAAGSSSGPLVRSWHLNLATLDDSFYALVKLGQAKTG